MQQTFRNTREAPEAGANNSSSSEIFHVEHSAFSASAHPLLGAAPADPPGGGSGGGGARTLTHDRVDAVWQDAVCFNPEATAALAAKAAADEQQQAGPGVMEYLAHWDFCNPGKTIKKRSRNGRNKSSRDRNRFSSKVPFHRKADVIDDLAWTFGQTMMMGAGGAGGAGGATTPDPSVGATGSAGKMGPPGAVPSPAGSAGPATPVSIMTPKGPASVKTPGDPHMLNSEPPPSNGPLTPAGGDGAMAPRTPKSVPQYPGVASPFPNVKSVENKRGIGSVKQEEPLTPAPAENGVQGQQQLDDVKQEPAAVEQTAFGTSLSKKPQKGSSGPFKRPALPLKEYQAELEREEVLSDDVYDHKSLQHWLNYPVKKFRPIESKKGDAFRPLYRRNSQANMIEAISTAPCAAATSNSAVPHDSTAAPTTAAAKVANPAAEEHKVNGVDVKEEPMEVTNGVENGKRIKSEGSHFNSSDPYEFSDEKKDGKVRRKCQLI